jgi:hypothetical protein
LQQLKCLARQPEDIKARCRQAIAQPYHSEPNGLTRPGVDIHDRIELGQGLEVSGAVQTSEERVQLVCALVVEAVR